MAVACEGFCGSTRRFPLQPNVSQGCNQLRSLPTPTWQTEPRVCVGEGVIFNSCASIIKADSVCKIDLGERSDCRLSAPLWTSSWIKAQGRDGSTGGSRANLPSSAEIELWFAQTSEVNNITIQIRLEKTAEAAAQPQERWEQESFENWSSPPSKLMGQDERVRSASRWGTEVHKILRLWKIYLSLLKCSRFSSPGPYEWKCDW